MNPFLSAFFPIMKPPINEVMIIMMRIRVLKVLKPIRFKIAKIIGVRKITAKGTNNTLK